MDDKLFVLIVEQNKITHDKIDSLADDLRVHTSKDERMWEKVSEHEGALPGLRKALYWLGTICLSAIGGLAAWLMGKP